MVNLRFSSISPWSRRNIHLKDSNFWARDSSSLTRVNSKPQFLSSCVVTTVSIQHTSELEMFPFRMDLWKPWCGEELPSLLYLLSIITCNLVGEEIKLLRLSQAALLTAYIPTQVFRNPACLLYTQSTGLNGNP